MADTPRAPQAVSEIGVPIWGICYGQHTMCQQLDGRVEPSTSREFGRATLEVVEACTLFDELWPVGATRAVWMSHGSHVVAPAPGFPTVANSSGAPYAVVANDGRR